MCRPFQFLTVQRIRVEIPNPFVVRKFNVLLVSIEEREDCQKTGSSTMRFNFRQLGKRLADIRGLLDRLDASMLRKREPFLPTVLRQSPSVTREPDLPTVQRLAPPSHVTSDVLTTEDAEASAAAAAADIDPLRGPADEPDTFLPPDAVYDRRAHAASASAVLQEELAAQLAHVAGQLRRNAEHFSRRAGGGPEGVRRVAEEKVGANHEVMKRERERLCDRRWKALRTTCLAISNVERRHRDCGFGDALCHSVHMRGDRRLGISVVMNQLFFQ
ncbi:hypothetical protein EDB83DRAFT_400377 [Lactarius deliciosus]|nr:hypothetical protein EDB83DRAFT_400377 [Lactarius deliciosus]